MKITKRVKIISVCVLILCIGALIYFVETFELMGCGNKIYTTLVSPKNDYTLIIFERNCGATTSLSTHISLIPRGEELNMKEDVGNVFVVDSSYDKSKDLHSQGGPSVVAKWTNETTLTLTFDSQVRVFSQVYKLKDINITYNPLAM